MITIEDKVNQLYKQFHTYDVFKLIDFCGIFLLYADLDDDTWGFTTSHCRVRTININNKLTYESQLFVIAHELGHCLLHKGFSTPFMRNAMAGSYIPKIEKEANQFAFKLLTSTLDISELQYMNKYNILDYLGLPYEMERFI